MIIDELYVIPEDNDLEIDEEQYREYIDHVQELLKKHKGNKLKVIFDLQKELDDYIDSLRGINRDNKTLWVKRNLLASTLEVGEFIEGTNWKWWKAPKELDEKYLLEELADILHFVTSASITAGIKPDSLGTLENIFKKASLRAGIIDNGDDEETILQSAMLLIEELANSYNIPETFPDNVEKIYTYTSMLTILIKKTPSDLFRAYIIKNFKNRARQISPKFRSGEYYAGERK